MVKKSCKCKCGSNRDREDYERRYKSEMEEVKKILDKENKERIDKLKSQQNNLKKKNYRLSFFVSYTD